MSNVVFRRASHSDKRQIFSIATGLFGWLDPIFSRFDVFFDNPYRYHYLAEVDGKAVSFLGLKVLDEGRTLYHYGARTHEDFVNRGMQTELLKYAVADLKETYCVERILGISFSPKYDEDYFARSTTKKLLVLTDMICLTFNRDKFAKFLSPEWTSLQTKPLTKLAGHEVASRVMTGQMTFEQNLVFVDYTFCEASPINDEFFRELIHRAYIEFTGSGTEEGAVKSFSSVSAFPHCNGVVRKRYDVDLDCPDFDSALQHCLRHVLDCLEESPTDQEFEVIIRCQRPELDTGQLLKFFLNEATDGIIRSGAFERTHWKGKAYEILGVL